MNTTVILKKVVEDFFRAKVLEALKEFIIAENHPCLMAQGVIRSQNFMLYTMENSARYNELEDLMLQLKDYILKSQGEPYNYASFIVAFNNSVNYNEIEFETMLWSFLQSLHILDDDTWDVDVSADPDNGDFSFSLHGTAFYIVGMHPNSSRKARRFPYPIIVFNLHEQFESLRRMGTYTSIRNRIRKRDKKKNGSINPMLKDFGTISEARQYSGRKVGNEWKCPFHNLKN